jgi:organic radical activating enzyme
MENYLSHFVYVEFLISYGCNYNCSYCFWVNRLKKDYYMLREKGPLAPRNPLRKVLFPLLQKIGVMDYADAMLNYDLEEWKDLFRVLFKGKNAYVSFTGGEPFLLWKQIFELVKVLEKEAATWMVRVDTNGTVVPPIPEEWKSHLSFNVSCHREQMRDFDKFMENLGKITAGAQSVMVNRVVHTEEEMGGIYDEVRMFRDRGYFLNVAPDHFQLSQWSPESQQKLRALIHPVDFKLKMEKKTLGKKCIYPAFGFQLLPNGFAWVPPCHDRVINLMKTQDPSPLLSPGGMTCPSDDCVCLHQYSFIVDENVVARNKGSMDILGSYVAAQTGHRKAANL